MSYDCPDFVDDVWNQTNECNLLHPDTIPQDDAGLPIAADRVCAAIRNLHKVSVAAREIVEYLDGLDEFCQSTQLATRLDAIRNALVDLNADPDFPRRPDCGDCLTTLAGAFDETIYCETRDKEVQS